MKKLLLIILSVFSSQLFKAQDYLPFMKFDTTTMTGKWGFCDVKGRVVLSPRYQHTGSMMHNGRAVVEDNGFAQLIDSTGKVLFTTKLPTTEIKYYEGNVLHLEDSLNVYFVNLDGKVLFKRALAKGEELRLVEHFFYFTQDDSLGKIEIYRNKGFKKVLSENKAIIRDFERDRTNKGNIYYQVNIRTAEKTDRELVLDTAGNILFRGTENVFVKGKGDDEARISRIIKTENYTDEDVHFPGNYGNFNYGIMLDSFKTGDKVKAWLKEHYYYIVRAERDGNKTELLYKYPSKLLLEMKTTDNADWKANKDYDEYGEYYFVKSDSLDNETYYTIDGKRAKKYIADVIRDRFLVYQSADTSKLDFTIVDYKNKKKEAGSFHIDNAVDVLNTRYDYEKTPYQLEVKYSYQPKGSKTIADTSVYYIMEPGTDVFRLRNKTEGINSLEASFSFSQKESDYFLWHSDFALYQDSVRHIAKLVNRETNFPVADLYGYQKIWLVNDTFIAVKYTDRCELYDFHMKKITETKTGIFTALIDNDPAKPIFFQDGKYSFSSGAKKCQFTENELSGFPADYVYKYGEDSVAMSYLTGALSGKKDTLLFFLRKSRDNVSQAKEFSMVSRKIVPSCDSVYELSGMEAEYFPLSALRSRLMQRKNSCYPKGYDFFMDTMYVSTPAYAFFDETSFKMPAKMENYFFVVGNTDKNYAAHLTDLNKIIFSWKRGYEVTGISQYFHACGTEDNFILFDEKKNDFDYQNVYDGTGNDYEGSCLWMHNGTTGKYEIWSQEGKKLFESNMKVNREFTYGEFGGTLLMEKPDGIRHLMSGEGKTLYDTSLYFLGSRFNEAEMEDYLPFIVLQSKKNDNSVLFSLRTGKCTEIPDTDYQLMETSSRDCIFFESASPDSLGNKRYDIVFADRGIYLRGLGDPFNIDLKTFDTSAGFFYSLSDENGKYTLYNEKGEELKVK